MDRHSNTKKHGMTRRRILGIALVAAIFVSGCFWGSHPAIAILNDLEFTVAISRCDGKNALDDPILISTGTQKVLHPGSPCVVSGPAERTGGVLNPGSYIGCLLVPSDSERSGVTLRASAADRNIGERACDEAP